MGYVNLSAGELGELGFSLKPPKWLRKSQPLKTVAKVAKIAVPVLAAMAIPGVAPLVGKVVATGGKLIAAGAKVLVTKPAAALVKSIGTTLRAGTAQLPTAAIAQAAGESLIPDLARRGVEAPTPTEEVTPAELPGTDGGILTATTSAGAPAYLPAPYQGPVQPPTVGAPSYLPWPAQGPVQPQQLPAAAAGAPAAGFNPMLAGGIAVGAVALLMAMNRGRR